jgi:hypothetical protein
MQLPGSFAEGPEKVGGAWSVEDGTPVLLEDFEGFEYVFVTETADGMRVAISSSSSNKVLGSALMTCAGVTSSTAIQKPSPSSAVVSTALAEPTGFVSGLLAVPDDDEFAACLLTPSSFFVFDTGLKLRIASYDIADIVSNIMGY